MLNLHETHFNVRESKLIAFSFVCSPEAIMFNKQYYEFLMACPHTVMCSKRHINATGISDSYNKLSFKLVLHMPFNTPHSNDSTPQ